MRISTTESSTHSSALATLTRLALLPRKPTVVVPPPLTNKGGLYFTLASLNVLISFSSLESSYLSRLVVMVIVWFWFSLPQSLANRVLMPMIRIVMFQSITTPIAPFNFDLAGRGLHANRVTVPLGCFDRYFCRGHLLILYRTLFETLIPNHCQLSKRVKKNGIMIPSPRSGGYRSFFNSLPPYPPITKLLQGILKYTDKLQICESLAKSGVMIYPLASPVEHLFKGSYALFAIAVYDHTSVEDFAKPVFMVESAKASTDFSNFLK
ncbi:unnamed protein product [Arabidopsis thaliana]|uniref:Uncharacterized protein n=1 Tax=Arabidopsis thaliana TaxID=3702 RepID=A0A5S9XQB6_ARATH|nr:unnamed protein product [Arabidopsis thaliana]